MNVFLRLLDKNSPCEKLATVGDNFIIRSILQLYPVLNKGNMKICSFRTIEEAMDWLSGSTHI